MAISWGSYDGHLRVGIDYSVSPASPSHSTTSVNVTWKYYVGTDGWNFSGDASTLHESADGWGGTADAFTNNLSSGSMLVGTHTETYSISYSSGTKSASANLTGAYNGATPSHSRTISLPDRPVAVPSAGEAPTAGTITSSSAIISWDVPNDDGGGTVDDYQLQVAVATGFAGPVIDVTGLPSPKQHTCSGLDSNRTYYARVRAHNSAGWGDWTDATFCPFTTLSATPSTPGTPILTAATQTALTVGWTPSSTNGGGSITYTVQCATNNTFTTGLTTASGLTGTSHQFTGLTAGTTYYFRVKATNSNGDSSYSGTLTTATLASLTYNDSGDYVTQVNNLASAVADKLVHLGMSTFRGRTSGFTLISGSVLTFSMSTAISTQGPDNPTYTGSSTNDYTIQYPGEYAIEFMCQFPESVSTGTFLQCVFVNGSRTSSGGGVTVVQAPAPGGSSYPRLLTIHRRLAVGDTIGWGMYQNSGSTQTVSGGTSWTYYATGRVTLVGF